MGKAKNHSTLIEMTKDVNSSWKSARKAQLGRWRSFLFELGYSSAFIEEYLRLGLLPRMIDLTYEYYFGLLTTARELLYNQENQVVVWKGSQAEALIKHHSKKLSMIRTLATNYRDHLYRSYIHLRDAKKKEFRDLSMADGLYKQYQALAASKEHGGAPLENGSGNTGSNGNNTTGSGKRCSLCGRVNLHDAGKRNCPGIVLDNPGQVKKVLKGYSTQTVSLDKMKAACQMVKDQLAATPDGNVTDMIAEARKKILGDD